MKIIDEPVFLTSGVRPPTDDDTLIVRRAALAVVFALRVRTPKGQRGNTDRRLHVGR